MTLVVTHTTVTGAAASPEAIVGGPDWDANHTLTGTVDASQLNTNVVQAVANDTNIQGSIAAQTLTFSWGSTLAATRGGFGADVSASSGVPLFATGVATFTGTTGTGNFARATSPTFVTPTLGAATATSINGNIITAGSSTLTLTANLTINSATAISAGVAGQVAIWNAGNLSGSATPTLGASGTLGSVTFGNATSGLLTLQPVTGALGTVTVLVPAAADTLVGKATTDTFTNKTFDTAGTGNSFMIAGFPVISTTGTGSVAVRQTSPTLITPALGTPTSGTLTSCTGLPLSTGVTGNLSVNNLNSGTSASSSTFWRGDGTWSTPAGGGTVTSSGSPVTGQIPRFTSGTDIAGISLTVTPQGRLTIASAVPVMASTVTGATSVWYTPFIGQVVPIYDGTTMVPTVFTELSQATSDTTKSPAAVAASKVYDIFVWNDAGTIRATRGPAWTNDTTRGYTLTMVQGILLNTSSITNGPAASRGTWVGTVRSNGSSTIDYILGGSASGGTAGFLGVRNYYNRVLTTLNVVDSGATYTYTVTTIRQARASAGNQITFISFGDDAIDAAYATENSLINAANGFANSGIGLDTTTAYSSPRSLVYNVSATANMVLGGVAVYRTIPALGVHFISGNQASDGTNAQVFDNNSKDTLSLCLMN